jgi:hypothetical protein
MKGLAFVKTVREGFETTYIDPHDLVSFNVTEVLKNMEKYLSNPILYVAPYTCLVTSSMMGKSRLIKEMTRLLPTIFVCAREIPSFGGFPPATPMLMSWFKKGAHAVTNNANEIKEDAKGVNIISTLQYSLFLVSTLCTLSLYLNIDDFLTKYEVYEYASRNDYSWMWNFFADIKNKEDEENLDEFWENVLNEVKKKGNGHFTINGATDYYKKSYQGAAMDAYNGLKKNLTKVGYDVNRNFTLLLAFDEAYQFCQLAAADGKTLIDDSDIFRHSNGPSKSYASTKDTFSGFHALKRAIRLLCFGNINESIRAFGLFTDTTSRIMNFQPLPGENRSLRELDIELGVADNQHFEPLMYFTTIDAYSRVYNACALVENVADPERLVNFGRAGWRDMYYFTAKDVRLASETAQAKLINQPGRTSIRRPWLTRSLSHAELIRLLAVLAPRICITAGPYTLEASELVASHMAVLMKTDEDRHFLRIFYPSEPMLAEGAANLLTTYGWSKPLQALQHYIQTGIIEGGFRGELLTKIICLMAVDEVNFLTKKEAEKDGMFPFSRPVRVSDFLNHLISLDGISNKPKNCSAKSVTEYILANTHQDINRAKLKRFLSGYVFFTHFAQVNHIIDIATLAQFFNRGAAIMCKPCNPGFDHVIPVMFEDANVAQFGSLHGQWSEEEAAYGRAGMSAIYIDSKDYTSDKNWTTHVQHVSPSTNGRSKNFDDEPIDNVFISIIQDFGEGKNLSEHVEIGPNTSHEMTLRQRYPKSQIQIVMRGVSDRTYECLKFSEAKNQTEGEMEDRIQYLRELRSAKVDFLEVKAIEDEERKDKIMRAVHDFATVFVGNGTDHEMDAAWAKERKRMVELTNKGKRIMGDDGTDLGRDVTRAKGRKETPAKLTYRGKKRRVA